MIIVWGLVIFLFVLGLLLDNRFIAAALLTLGLYAGSMADAKSSQRI